MMRRKKSRDEAISTLNIAADERVVMVGYFAPVIAQLRKICCQLDIVMANLRVLPGQIVLDAGCGNGYMSKELSRAVGDRGKVYALDPDETSIEKLRVETAGTNIEAPAGDIIDVGEHLYMQLFENRTKD